MLAGAGSVYALGGREDEDHAMAGKYVLGWSDGEDEGGRERVDV